MLPEPRPLDPRPLISLIVTSGAFAQRGDSHNARTPVSPEARGAAAAGRDALVHILLASCNGADVALDTKAMVGIARDVDRLLRSGTHGLGSVQIRALLAWRAAVVARIEHDHPNGDVIVEMIPPAPVLREAETARGAPPAPTPSGPPAAPPPASPVAPPLEPPRQQEPLPAPAKPRPAPAPAAAPLVTIEGDTFLYGRPPDPEGPDPLPAEVAERILAGGVPPDPRRPAIAAPAVTG